MERRKDDLLWKAVLEEIFEDFLCFFFSDANERFNLRKGFVYLNKELDQLNHTGKEVPGVRFVGKLVKVFLNTDKNKSMLIHIEVQRQKGKEDFSERMFRYWYRIKDKYNMPVTAFAILTDGHQSFYPKDYKEDCLGKWISYRFNTYKLADQEEMELRSNLNPFSVGALVVLMALKDPKADDEQWKRIKHDLVVN